MTGIAEHDGEDERERGDGEQSRIDLAVVGDTVSVDQRLEAFGELVGAVERRPHLLGLHRRQDRLEGADFRILLVIFFLRFSEVISTYLTCTSGNRLRWRVSEFRRRGPYRRRGSSTRRRGIFRRHRR